MTEYLVTPAAERPAGKPGQCFYCRQAVGAPHAADCVMIVKPVRVRMTIEFERWCPADWDRSMVEFHLGESSWCAANALGEIEEWEERRGETSGSGCLCDVAEFEYLHEAGPARLIEMGVSAGNATPVRAGEPGSAGDGPRAASPASGPQNDAESGSKRPTTHGASSGWWQSSR